MFALTLKNLFAHKMRMISTAFAVVLGVAFMAGTLVFADTLSATFGDVLAEANNGVDVLVRADRDLDLGDSGATIDASTVDLVRQMAGVDQAEVRVSGYAQLVGPDGLPIGDPNLGSYGFNWSDVEALNPYRLVAGRAPTADTEIVIDRASASSVGFEPGDSVTVLTKGEPRRFTIAGIATFGSADSAAGANAVLFTAATAQELLAVPGQVEGVVVTSAAGVSQDELASRIEAVVPDGIGAITGEALVAEDKAAFDADFGLFKTFLLVFAGIAVFVGAFIINNTFSITVAQRSKEMAMLRALGASRRQVLGSVLIEAGTTGVVASAVGLVAGIGVAQALRAMLASFGINLPGGPPVIGVGSMLVAFTVGVVVTAVSAVLPARRASRVLPIAALRDVAIDRSSSSRRRALSGFVVTAIGVVVLLIGLGGGGVAAVGGGAVVSLIGFAVLGPIFARPGARLLGLPLQLSGITGDMATQNAMRSPKRTARTASALMIGVALVSFITVFGASVKTSFAGSLDDNFRGTHVVESGTLDGAGAGLSPELASALRATPGVDAVAETRFSPAIINGKQNDFFEAFKAAAIQGVFDLGTVEGDLGLLGADGIAVQSDYAAENDLSVGSVLPVTLPTGEFDFTVRALYEGNEWFGDQFLDIAAYDTYLPGLLDARIYLSGDGAAISSAAAPYPTAEVQDRDEFFASQSGELDQLLGVVYAMLALAVLMALFGIANTLALSIFERTREIGLLRAIGMTRRQISATVRGESIIIALFGTTGGLAVGTFFGWATMHALADQGFDEFSLPVGQLAFIAGLAALAGAVTAVLPARKAARLPILDALVAQ